MESTHISKAFIYTKVCILQMRSNKLKKISSHTMHTCPLKDLSLQDLSIVEDHDPHQIHAS